MKNLLISLSIFFTSGLFAEESPLSIAKNFGGICRDERHLGAKVVNHGQFQKSENDIRIDEITYALEELYRGNGSHLWDLFACDLKITPDLASAILFISYNYHPDGVRLLLAFGADVINYTLGHLSYPSTLQNALTKRTHNSEAISLLLANDPCNDLECAKSLFSALIGNWNEKINPFDSLKLLINKYRGHNIPNIHHDWILVLRALIECPSDIKEILQFLHNNQLNVNQPNPDGLTPLVAAVNYCPNLDAIQFLIDMGGDVNTVDEDNFSLVRIAFRNQNQGLVDLLIENGADWNTVHAYSEWVILIGGSGFVIPLILNYYYLLLCLKTKLD